MAETNLKKNKQGYGYKYTDLSQIHEYLEANDLRYEQFIKVIDGVDYIFTQKIVDGKKDGEPIQGCRVVQATLSGKSNPAQEQRKCFNLCKTLQFTYGLWLSY